MFKEDLVEEPFCRTCRIGSVDKDDVVAVCRCIGDPGDAVTDGELQTWIIPGVASDRGKVELAEATKRIAKRAEAKARDAERAAAQTPSAVAAKMLDQLRESEQQEAARLRRSDLPKAERRLAREKLERIQQRLADAAS